MARLGRGGATAMYAVIASGGKQYRVQNGDIIYVEKLNAQEGDEISFDTLLYFNDETLDVGTPVLQNITVKGRVLRHNKGQKLIVYKYKSKKNYRRKNGHRQPYTMVEILPIAQ
jgi:large subunit ribosomal protein L21